MDIAVKTMDMVSTGLEIVSGGIGYSAYEKCGQDIDVETLDALAECKGVICGPVQPRTDGRGKMHDPLDVLKTHMGLFAMMRPFETYGNHGVSGVSAKIWAGTTAIGRDAVETRELDGITLTKYVRMSFYQRTMRLACADMKLHGEKEVACISRDDIFPESSALFRQAFDETFGEGFERAHLNVIRWAEEMVSHPLRFRNVICADLYSNVAAGIAAGLTGGNRLAPYFYPGDNTNLVYINRPGDFQPDGTANPTSALVSVALTLQYNSRIPGADTVMDALRATYAEGTSTPDMGGTATAREFADRFFRHLRYALYPATDSSAMMKDTGHRACVEAALNFEETDRVPVNNFALVTAARSAGVTVEEARWNPKLSAKVSVDYALKTESDFVKPVLDSQVPFIDLGMDVSMPENDYGRVHGKKATNAEEIDDLALFDPYAAAECPNFTKVFVESLEETSRILPEDLHICGLSWGPFTTAGYVMGMEDMIMNTMMEPDLVKKLVAKVTQYVSGIQRRMVDAGATVMWMADPSSSEDMISADMFQEFSHDAIRKVVSDVKAEDPSIPAFIHICGKTLDTIPCLFDTGADCLSFDHAVDPGQAKKAAAGKIALMGNIDPVQQILYGNPQGITEECNRIMGLAAEGGGFVLAPGCETPLMSPDENVLAMGRAGRDFFGH